jgi:sulfur transfer protein SufE
MFSDLFREMAGNLNNLANKTEEKYKKTCLHSNKVPDFQETMKYEFTACKRCRDCDSKIWEALTLEEKKSLYLSMFDYFEEINETDPHWMSLRDDGGFNL